MAQAYEVDYEHLCKFFWNGWNIDDAMKSCRDKIYGIGKLYEYEGKVYRSPQKLAETYGLPWQSLARNVWNSRNTRLFYGEKNTGIDLKWQKRSASIRLPFLMG